MSSMKETRTLGLDATCDIQIEHPSVSPVHARIELAEDGLVSLQDADSAEGIFLNRNSTWIRVNRVTLCIGDRIRLGEVELPLQRLTAIFGKQSNARLESIHYALQGRNRGNYGQLADQGSQLKKPRRNPLTGKIEERGAG